MKTHPAVDFIEALSPAEKKKVIDILSQNLSEPIRNNLKEAKDPSQPFVNPCYFILDRDNDVGHTHFCVEIEYRFQDETGRLTVMTGDARAFIEFDDCFEFENHRAISAKKSKLPHPEQN